jgi:uncharacterized protein
MPLQLRPAARVEALPRAALARLARLLASCARNGSMQLEEVDGFFAALIAGPVRGSPHEHWSAVFGGDIATLPPEHCERLNDALDLLNQHWHSIEDTLVQGLPLGPLLLEDPPGAVRGQAWARGFLRGVDTHRDRWDELINDPLRRAALTPMVTLTSDDTRSVDPARRAELLTDATLAVSFLFRHFQPTAGAPTAGTSALH